MCALSFEGKGYTDDFVKNYAEIASAVKSNPSAEIIKISFSLDSICTPCPNHNKSKCNKQMLIDSLDHSHAKILEVKDGDTLTWNSALNLIKEKMTIEKFHIACNGCEWKKFGMCEQALKNLKRFQ